MNCPDCGNEARVPTVDNGVGEEQCGPAYCESCEWVQAPLPGFDEDSRDW